MRVIGGEARGRRLTTPAGRRLRPTSDRVREALFNILAPRLAGARFLDLFAGTGAVAIEALSRGCAEAVLVEREPGHATLIRTNLQSCGLQERAELLVSGVEAALGRLQRQGRRFDILFADPPYRAEEDRRRVLHRLSGSTLLAAGALVVLEGPARRPLPLAPGLALRRRQRYGDTLLGFYAAAEGKDSPRGAAGTVENG